MEIMKNTTNFIRSESRHRHNFLENAICGAEYVIKKTIEAQSTYTTDLQQLLASLSLLTVANINSYDGTHQLPDKSNANAILLTTCRKNQSFSILSDKYFHTYQEDKIRKIRHSITEQSIVSEFDNSLKHIATEETPLYYSDNLDNYDGLVSTESFRANGLQFLSQPAVAIRSGLNRNLSKYVLIHELCHTNQYLDNPVLPSGNYAHSELEAYTLEREVYQTANLRDLDEDHLIDLDMRVLMAARDTSVK